MADKLVLVGRVAGAFGVRGEVRISAYTASPMALVGYRDLVAEDGSPALTLLSGRAVKDGVICRAKEIETKEDADRLRGLRLFVPRDRLPPTDEDEYYLTDLIGMAVVSLTGEAMGSIKAVHTFGAGDVLEVDPGEGAKTWYLPFTRQAAPVVDIAAGRVTADPPAEVSDQD
jgi:16S rRNA processing protein RimM